MRVIGSLAFTLFHIGRVAIVIYLPTLAITSVSDINPYLIAALVGLLCVIYTFMGGIEGGYLERCYSRYYLIRWCCCRYFLRCFPN